MRKSAAIVAAVLLILAIFSQRDGSRSTAQEVPAPPAVQKWEYLVVNINSPEISTVQNGKYGLNAYGKEGWEYCQAVPVESQGTSVILKRHLR